MHRVVFWMIFLATCALSPAHAFDAAAFLDGVAVELGRSYPYAVNVARLQAFKDWRIWPLGARWQLTSYWQGGFGYWDNDSRGAETPSVWEIALTPVFRLQPQAPGANMPYLELASGMHLISEKRVNDRRDLGGHFQFGSHFGVGVRFGEQRRYDVSVRVQHLSNARLKQPNDGINFATVRFAYFF